MRTGATRALSWLMVALGAVILIRTVVAGAGAGLAFGYIFGAGLLLAGVLRLYLLSK